MVRKRLKKSKGKSISESKSENKNENANRSEKSSSMVISEESIISLIDSITKDAEEKVLLEDNVKGIIRETEILSSYVHDMPVNKRKKLLLTYSKILQKIKNNVDNMLEK
jgi:activator of HSP90 ATPase